MIENMKRVKTKENEKVEFERVDNHTILIIVNKDIVKPTEGHEVLRKKRRKVTEEEADDWEAIDVSPDEDDEDEWEEVSVPSKKK